MDVAATKAKNAAAHEAVGDSLLSAGQYKEAQIEYQKTGDNMPISTANKLALAFTLQDNIQLAIAFIRPLMQEKKAGHCNALNSMRISHFCAAKSLPKHEPLLPAIYRLITLQRW